VKLLEYAGTHFQKHNIKMGELVKLTTPSAGSTFSINLVWLAGCTKMLPFLIGNFETRADDSQIDFDYASNTLNEEKPQMGTPTDTTS
jgi:hypothetical protein